VNDVPFITSLDWRKADIKAALRQKGVTLKGLTLANGYRSVDACAQALQRPYPKVERIIAAAIGVAPEEIWPSRYPVNKQAQCSSSARTFKANLARTA